MIKKNISLLIVVLMVSLTSMTSLAAHGENILRPEEKLSLGQWLQSNNQQYRLYMKPTGTLVLYNIDKEEWRSPTCHTDQWNISECMMEGTTGNFVIRAFPLFHDPQFPYGKPYPIWSTRTWGNPGARLILQDDGLLVLWSGNTPIWSVPKR